jgi:hypothetical protein
VERPAGSHLLAAPLSDLRAAQIRSIDIADHNNHRVQISDRKGIEFFLAKTKSLRAKKDFKVNPEFKRLHWSERSRFGGGYPMVLRRSGLVRFCLEEAR